ncbi:MAG: leucine-rich repeat domain-containing protein, partial [Clostridiales bacterium]|nr:leucine-rich repeat domain-containing protein [Clostridiales bacterium]
DDKEVTCDRKLVTGADGRITLKKTANGYPRVKFIEDTVYLNHYKEDEFKTDDLRLRELPEESDESWGLLAGYGSKDNLYDYSLDLEKENAIAFVNTNRTAPVEIEKKMEHPSDATFTMILRQVTAASKDPIEQPEQILASEARPGIEYTVYDKVSGNQIRTDATGAKGEIHLKAGQYARLYLPDGTKWTVSEEQKADHMLKSVSGDPKEKVQTWEGKNLALIQSRAEKVGILTAITSRPKVVAGTGLNKNEFTVTVCYSDGGSEVLKEGDFTITPETIPDDETGFMDITVTRKSDGMETTIPINVIGKGTITQEDVRGTLLRKPETGEKIVLNTGAVDIPEYVMRYEEGEYKEYLVTSIGNWAFAQNKDITSVQIPDSVTSIKASAFDGCSSLTGKLVLPEGLENIEAFAFQNCSGLTGDLVIPDSVTSLGSDAFDGCSGFTGSLVISSRVTRIESSTFEDCSGLTGNLVIPEAVTSIGSSAFKNCSNLTGNLVIPENVTGIGYNAFEGCTGFTGSLKISSKVTSIGGAAFSNCTGLTGGLEIPSGVTEIKYSTFKNCSGLVGNLDIPSKVTSIEDNAFDGCKGLTGSLVIPSEVTSIGSFAFNGCTGLTGNLEIPPKVTSIGSSAFKGCTGLTGNLEIPSNVTKIGGSAFAGCNLTGVIIPASITTMGNYIFSGCNNLTNAVIMPGVTTISPGAFNRCVSLKEIVIPGSVQSIGRYAFSECVNLIKVEIQEGVETIESTAFEYCKGLTMIEIPHSVTSIGISTFYACYALREIIIDNTENAIEGAPWDCSANVTWKRSITTP